MTTSKLILRTDHSWGKPPEYTSASTAVRYVYRFAALTPNGVRNLDDTDGAADLICELELHATTSGTIWPSTHLEYRDVYAIDNMRARLIYDTLRAIERRLAKLDEKRGPCADQAEYLGRLCEAARVTAVYVQRDATVRYSWLTDVDWKPQSIGDAVHDLRQSMRTWTEEHQAQTSQTAQTA